MSVLPSELIRRKRDGATLGEPEIATLVAGIVDGTVSDAQIAAFAMAVYFRGMTRGECAALTRAMTHSGTVLQWTADALGGPILDKHSTGGIGDKVSLILAPLVAACGGFVPMISGRGLGHTGGTLDKLASIPGYDTTPELARFRAAVRTAGCAIVGQTADLAPADRRLYAVRDVTATTDSLPLITASILSKKLAAGLDALVMDVKVGSGALLPSLETAVELAESLLAVGGAAGLPHRRGAHRHDAGAGHTWAMRSRCARRSTSSPAGAASRACTRSPRRWRASSWCSAVVWRRTVPRRRPWWSARSRAGHR